MESDSTEQNNQNIESKYSIYLKSNNLFFNRDYNQTKSKYNNQITVNSNRKYKKKGEEKKLSFTNLILRKKLNASKTLNQIYTNKFINVNENDIPKEENNLEKLIKICKLLKIRSIKAKDNNKIKIKNSIMPEKIKKKKSLHKNLSISSLDNILNIKNNNNNKKIFLKKISKGQQTMLDIDYSNLNIFQPDYHSNSIEANITRRKKQLTEKNNLKENIKKNDSNYNNKIKENKNEEKKEQDITDYMKNVNLSNSNENYNSIYNSISHNDNNNHKTYRYLLINNKSNIVDISNVKLDQQKKSMGLREIYRNIILAQKNQIKKKKMKTILKNKTIIGCSNNNVISNEYYKKSNNNLMSVENYTSDIEKSSKSHKILSFRKNKDRIFPKEFKLIDKKKLFGSTESKKNDDGGNFFTNILKSFSRVDERYNKVKLKMIGY